jgi:hypothetical protein
MRYEAAQSVGKCRPFLDKALPGAVQAEDDLLVFFLDRDDAHVGAGDGFADGLGVRRVVLAALARQAVGRDEFGCLQPDGVSVLTELSRPVVCAEAGFHADDARRQLRDDWQKMLSRYFWFDQRGLAALLNAVHGKEVLGEIDSDGDNVHGVLFRFLM